MNPLAFYDKEGNSLNFIYNDSLQRFEGDILFHENSSDTFKTQAIYLFEKVSAFEYENPSSLTTKKFQLFNEGGFQFYKGSSQYQIEKIEPTNTESNYFSKWIFGKKFDSVFRKGSFVRFDSQIFEFDPSFNLVYQVVSTKKNAILIISSTDNNTFDTTYNYEDSNEYINKTISAPNLIGINGYLTPNPFTVNLSYWNEFDFYDRIYDFRKLNIVNTQNNDDYRKTRRYDDVSVVTVKKSDIVDSEYFEYSVSESELSFGDDLMIELISRMDLPLIYQGDIDFNSNGTIDFPNGNIPSILKPGVEFQVTDSTLNNIFLNVSGIQIFDWNTQQIFYATGSQVIYNNKIRQCIQAYTWSGGIATFSSVGLEILGYPTPDDDLYWGDPTYLPVDQSIVNESVSGAHLYLTTDHFYYPQSFTQSSTVTLASAAQKWNQDLIFFGVDLGFNDDTLTANLIYSSRYVEVNFYINDVDPLNLIGTQSSSRSRLIECYEELSSENNLDISENFNYNIVFTDLDEYGIVLKINDMVYQSEINFLYSSGLVDMERTIDKTLRVWMARSFLSLISLGIIPSLVRIGSPSPYYNSINLKTEYPNVPIDFSVQVGSTADFYIEHTLIIFYDMGSYFQVTINGRNYGESFSGTIQNTLENWVITWSEIINDFGVFVTNQASSLQFNVKNRSTRCEISINVGKSSLPGIDLYKVYRRLYGNHGGLITSNEIVDDDVDANFESVGFATGQVVGINKTFYPLQNIEFNSLFLDPNVINLSYEGPFWGLSSSTCFQSAMSSVSINVPFGLTACLPSVLPNIFRGMYDNEEYFDDFSIEYIVTIASFSTSTLIGVTNSIDLTWVQSSNRIFVIGDSIGIYDSITSQFIEEIVLPNASNPIDIVYNTGDGYVYALTEDFIYQVDPYTNEISNYATFSQTAISIGINPINGQVYVGFGSNGLYIYDSGLVSFDTYAINSNQMIWNDFEESMYICGSGQVIRINGSTFTTTTFTTSGVGSSSEIILDYENESIWVSGSSNVYKIDNGSVDAISISSTSDLIFNNLSSGVNILNGDLSSIFVDDNSVQWFSSGSGNGYLGINQFDGKIYVTTNSDIKVFDSLTGLLESTIGTASTTRLIYNPDRISMWILRPSSNEIIEVKSNLGGTFVYESTPSVTSTDENFYGSLEDGYVDKNYLWIHTKDYIRSPRENFEGESRVSLIWKWYSDNVPEFFLYDFSGSQLSTDGIFAYKGPKPLNEVYLNRSPNRELSRVADSKYQQTIFSEIKWDLDYIDDNFDISVVPSPLQLFIGFNSSEEGPLRSVLQLIKREDVDFTILPTPVSSNNFITIETIEEDGDRFGRVSLDTNSTEYFTNRGLKIGQHLAIFVKDITNSKDQYISNNNGYLVKIRGIYPKSIEVDYFKSVDSFKFEKNVVEDYPKVGKTSYLSIRFKVWDRELGRFNVYGQTEIEDIRYQIELNNAGKIISSDDVYIFKEYDIKEDGIDWIYLNSKRKEMLMMKHLIYPYIGSYKAIINAINYFGYNDLELYEYYRNINQESSDFGKLFKVEIPDIFDNTVEGWNENDFIKHLFPNSNYEDTNLFNLTFRITDGDGNNVLNYTLREIQIKLQGLKYWLQKNIIPITHKILDITGRADFVGLTKIDHISRDVSIFNVYQNFTPVIFKLNEAYLMPVNNGSTVYNCVLDFEVGSSENLPDYYTISIRAYEIYREWYPFKNYNIGDRVIYYNKAYESVIDNNKTNNPRKFENSEPWISGTIYNVADIVRYERDVFVFTNQGGITASNTAPIIDPQNWFKATEWKEIDLQPVDTIFEWRDIDNLQPFNFTIDSNISPYLVINVNSSNGWGMNYTDRKNYEIRGILDIRELESFANLTSKQYRMSLPSVGS